MAKWLTDKHMALAQVQSYHLHQSLLNPVRAKHSFETLPRRRQPCCCNSEALAGATRLSLKLDSSRVAAELQPLELQHGASYRASQREHTRLDPSRVTACVINEQAMTHEKAMTRRTMMRRTMMMMGQAGRWYIQP
jgi:hypothetical protein